MAGTDNSKKTRVEPVFGWFEKQPDLSWPAQLLRLRDLKVFRTLEFFAH